MKKLLICLLLITLGVYGWCYYNYNLTPIGVYQEIHNRVTENQTDTLEDQLSEIKQQQQEKEERRLELLKLQNPEIIYDQLQKTDTRICCKGTTKYSDVILNNKWYGHKELDVELYYDFGIGIESDSIIVKEFYEDTVVIQIPKSEMKLLYISLNTDSSNLISNKSAWVGNYSPEDVKEILKESQNKVTDNINNNKEFYDEAMVSAKTNIEKEIINLGFKDVIFEEI